MLVTGALGLLIIIFIIWFSAPVIGRFRANPTAQPVTEIVKFSDPIICKQILKCEDYSNTGAENLYTEVESRAIPNHRLICAFGIDNSFTTCEDERHREFKTEAGKAIKMTEAKVSTSPPKKSLLSQLACMHTLGAPIPSLSFNCLRNTRLSAMTKEAMLTSTLRSGKSLQNSQKSLLARLYPCPS